jgi:hypothetical protein
MDACIDWMACNSVGGLGAALEQAMDEDGDFEDEI